MSHLNSVGGLDKYIYREREKEREGEWDRKRACERKKERWRRKFLREIAHLTFVRGALKIYVPCSRRPSLPQISTSSLNSPEGRVKTGLIGHVPDMKCRQKWPIFPLAPREDCFPWITPRQTNLVSDMNTMGKVWLYIYICIYIYIYHIYIKRESVCEWVNRRGRER